MRKLNGSIQMIPRVPNHRTLQLLTTGLRILLITGVNHTRPAGQATSGERSLAISSD